MQELNSQHAATNNSARLLHRNAKLLAQWPISWVGSAHNNVSAIEHSFIALCINAAQLIAQQLNKQQ